MSIFQNVTKGSFVKGSAILIVLAGALGVYFTQWGLFGFYLTGIPLWCFGVLASIGGVLFFLGPMIFGLEPVKRVEQLSKNSERMLFLYLRPFELDARNIVQLMVGASTGVLVYLGLLKGLWWSISFLPFAISISKEQSFQDVFETLGDFVAIGNPREWLQPIGASRVYTRKWKKKINTYMGQARLVIIRPGSTKGIQWEVKKVLKKVPPDRVLFYLRFRGSKKKQEGEYQAFREQLQRKCSIELPKQLGTARYLAFDINGTPYFIPEANHPAELIKQVFMGDISTDRLRPVLNALNIELPPRPTNVFSNTIEILSWLGAIVAILLVVVAVVRLLIILALVLLLAIVKALGTLMPIFFSIG